MLGKQTDGRISAPTLRQAQGRPERARMASVNDAWPFDRLGATLSGVEGWQALGVAASAKATASATEAKRRRGPQRTAREDAR